MKQIYQVTIALVLLLAPIMSYACNVCEKQQPEILKGVAHGAGPEQQWDYIIVSLIALIVLISGFYAVKWLLFPGEMEPDHIKRKIFQFE